MYEAQTTKYDNLVVGDNNIYADVLVAINDDSATSLTIPKGAIIGYDDTNLVFSAQKSLVGKGALILEDVSFDTTSTKKLVKVLISGSVNIDNVLCYNEHEFVKPSEMPFTEDVFMTILAGSFSFVVVKTLNG